MMRFLPKFSSRRIRNEQRSSTRKTLSRRRSGSHRRSAVFAGTQALEIRLVLTNSFGFDVIAQSDVTAGSVSVNNDGDVAYLDSDIDYIYVGDGLTPAMEIETGGTGIGITTDPGIQINNSGLVSETHRGLRVGGGPGAWFWGGLPAPGLRSFIANTAIGSYFGDIASTSGLSNDGNMAFAGKHDDTWEIHLSDTLVAGFSVLTTDTLVATLPAGAQFHLLAADGDRVAIASFLNGVDQIELFDITAGAASAMIASTASADWNDVGTNPGISDDGSVIAFYGDLSASGAAKYGLPSGPGIFASLQTGPTLGDRMLIRVDGDPGKDDGGAQIEFHFVPDDRVNVIRQRFGGAGFNADALVVGFIATPSAASPAGDASDPNVFTANTGFFTNRVDILNDVGDNHQVNRPLRVVQVGDMFEGDAITSLSLNDGLASPFESPDGTARRPGRGEHYFAFDAVTATDSYAVRANYLHNIVSIASQPPQRTQITGPILHAVDLTPTVTWAALPGTAVGYWEVLGYHILSGQQVINTQVPGSQTSLTLPSNASLGTHEFWVRGHNVSGALPWESGDRFYFHVLAPDAVSETVQITGPVDSISDAAPIVTWAEFPNAVGYDGLIYSVTRGMEVARFDNVGETSFQLPVLPTNDTYSVYVRARLGFDAQQWSGPIFFSTNASAPGLPAPTNIAPTGVTADPQPTFTWDAVPGAWDYDVALVGADTGLEIPQRVSQAIVTPPRYSVPFLLTPGNYTFSVRARNDAFEPGELGSTTITFAIIVSSEPSDLATPDDSLLSQYEFAESTETYPVVAYLETTHDELQNIIAPVEPRAVDVGVVDRPAIGVSTPPEELDSVVMADRVFVDLSDADDGMAMPIESSDDQQASLLPATAVAGLLLAPLQRLKGVDWSSVVARIRPRRRGTR